MLTIPDWQETYKGLPRIPEFKKYLRNGTTLTDEQIILFKIYDKKSVAAVEINILEKLISFYNSLETELKKLKYEPISLEELDKFKNYIFYAFNFIPNISNYFRIENAYRLVVNERVQKTNTTITDIGFLKYPSMDIVKDYQRFNRCSTPNSTLLYCAQTIDTALLEIRPPTDKLVTIGIWKQKNYNQEIIGYPISHNDILRGVNQRADDTLEYYSKSTTHFPVQMQDIMNTFLRILASEFTKEVSSHFDYIISALLSERMLQMNSTEGRKYDLMVYPSVGNKLKTENYAIKPSSLTEYFCLSEAIEFEISRTLYDRPSTALNPQSISLAEIKNMRRTMDIDSTGRIKWT